MAVQVENGANLLSEGLIFGVAGGLVIYEYRRKASKDAHSELREQARRLEVQSTLAELKEECAHLRLMLYKQQLGKSIDSADLSNEERDVSNVVEKKTGLEGMWDWASGAARRREEILLEQKKLEYSRRQAQAEKQAQLHQQAVRERVI